MEFEQYLEQANQDTSRFISRSIKKTLSYWWIILSSIALGLLIAFLIARYTSKIYTIGAKVMIEVSSQKLDPSSLLFDDRAFSNSQDVVNQLIILESYPILESAIIEASQNIKYFRTTEALERIIQIDEPNMPFSVHPTGDWVKESSLKNAALIGVYADQNNVVLTFDGKQIYSGSPDSVVLDDLGLKIVVKSDFPEKDIEYFFSVNSIQQTVIEYQARLETSLVEDRSTIVNLNLEGVVPNREIRFLQILLQNYLAANLQEKNLGALNTINFIDTELEIIKDSLRKIENRLELFKSRNKISNLQSEGEVIFEKLLDLEEDKALLILREKYLSLISEYLENDELDKLVTPSSFGVNDPSLSRLTEDLLKLSTERKLMGTESQGQIAQQFDARINELKKSLSNYIYNISQTNKIQLIDVNKRIGIIESSIQGLPISEMALMNIERLHNLSESLYLLLLEKKTEAEITRSSNTPDIRIIEDARLLSFKPIKPNKILIYLSAILVSVLIPLGVIILSVFLNNTIQDKDEITRVLNVPFMGFIASALDKPKGYIVDKPKSRLAESFRGLRSNLKYLSAKEGGKVILLSSCFPGEGKTFVSANLALSAASSGLKVVILGADLRKPKLHEHFDFKNQNGLSNYLVGNSSLLDVLQKTEEGLDVITAGPNPPNPLELLDSTRFVELLSELKTSYDLVLIDTSPFMLVSDARILFNKVDLNLIVLRNGFSKRSNLNLIKDLVDDFSDAKFSVVLNDQQHQNSYGYGNSQGYNGYGYYDEA